MKYILLLTVLLPAIAFADVNTKSLTPVVKITNDTIQLKDKVGNEYAVRTDCNIDVNKITEFTIRDRRVSEGTYIKLSKSKVCEVKEVAIL